MKGREPLLESASDERTCDGTETRFPLRFPQETENGNADGARDAAFSTTERRQQSKSEGDGSTPVDLLTLADGADLDRLAVELRRRLTPGDCRRLAELLTARDKDRGAGG